MYAGILCSRSRVLHSALSALAIIKRPLVTYGTHEVAQNSSERVHLKAEVIKNNA